MDLNLVEKITLGLNIKSNTLARKLNLSTQVLKHYTGMRTKNRAIVEEKIKQFLKDQELTEEMLDKAIERNINSNLIFFIAVKTKLTRMQLSRELKIEYKKIITLQETNKIVKRYKERFEILFKKYNLDLEPFNDCFVNVIPPKFLPFEEAREYVRSLNLENTKGWKMWIRGTLPGKEPVPSSIPKTPHHYYKTSGWVGWQDWLRVDASVQYLSFEEAREYIRKLQLKTVKQWQKLYQNKLAGKKLPYNIPWNPQMVYEDQWLGLEDWIGSKYMDFEEARAFARKLNLKGQIEWKLYTSGKMPDLPEKPINIPGNPREVYREKWTSFGDWVGTKRIKKRADEVVSKEWIPFEEARKFARSLELKYVYDWQNYIRGKFDNLPKLPHNLPRSPQYVYRNCGWISWENWLNIDPSNRNRGRSTLLVTLLATLDMSKERLAREIGMHEGRVLAWKPKNYIPEKYFPAIKKLLLKYNKDTAIIDDLIKD